jgi:hypothetical protein
MTIKEDSGRFGKSDDISEIIFVTCIITFLVGMYFIVDYVTYLPQQKKLLRSDIYYGRVDYGDGYRWYGVMVKGDVRLDALDMPQEWLMCSNKSEGTVVEEPEGYYVSNMTDEEFIGYLKKYLYYQKEPLHLTITHEAGDSWINETGWRIWPWGA